jgi:hypothetical protein
MDNEDLGRYQNMLPSRAVLARLSLFGTDEETRASANAILKALPPMNEKERREYYDETWRLAGLPSEEDMLKSPVGLATLEMLKNSSLPKEIQKAEPEGNVAPEPAAGAEQTSPAVEPVNPHLAALNWPPKASPPPKAPEDDGQRHLWQAAQPSKPDTSQRPISDWDSPDSRETLY